MSTGDEKGIDSSEIAAAQDDDSLGPAERMDRIANAVDSDEQQEAGSDAAGPDTTAADAGGSDAGGSDTSPTPRP